MTRGEAKEIMTTKDNLKEFSEMYRLLMCMYWY